MKLRNQNLIFVFQQQNKGSNGNDSSILSAPSLHPDDPLLDADGEENALQALARQFERKYVSYRPWFDELI